MHYIISYEICIFELAFFHVFSASLNQEFSHQASLSMESKKIKRLQKPLNDSICCKHLFLFARLPSASSLLAAKGHALGFSNLGSFLRGEGSFDYFEYLTMEHNRSKEKQKWNVFSAIFLDFSVV